MKHGRYSTLHRETIRGLIDRHEEDPDPLNLEPELAALRALFEDFVNRYEERTEALLAWHASFGETENEKPRRVLDLADARKILAEIGRLGHRIEGIRNQNAISMPELYRFLSEIEHVLRTEIPDEQVLKRIGRGIGQIRVRPNG